VNGRPPLGAYVRGPNAVLLWRDCREVLLDRLRRLERDPDIRSDLVRGHRAMVEDLEMAAREYREWDLARAATESAARSRGALEAEPSPITADMV
jgi:hypothetical protein